MDPHTILGAIQAFVSLLAAVGAAVKTIIERSSPAKTTIVEGSVFEGPIVINQIIVGLTPASVGLTPDLEAIVQERAPEGTSALEHWVRLNADMIGVNRQRFQTLVNMGVSEQAIGLEMLIQAISGDVARIADTFIKRRVPRLNPQDAALELGPSALLDTLKLIAQSPADSTIARLAQDLRDVGQARITKDDLKDDSGDKH